MNSDLDQLYGTPSNPKQDLSDAIAMVTVGQRAGGPKFYELLQAWLKGAKLTQYALMNIPDMLRAMDDAHLVMLARAIHVRFYESAKREMQFQSKPPVDARTESQGKAIAQ